MGRYFSLISLLIAGLVHGQSSYFQQQVDYVIDVKLDDAKHFIHGFETFQYTNNSPDTLSKIWIHLWPNAYKNNQTAFANQELLLGTDKFQFASDEERGFIDSLNFTSSDGEVEFSYDPLNQDIGIINLAKPLAPGNQVSISTSFRVKIPSAKFSRLGHVKQQYQLCQWYPKPAVYDNKGWHPMPYLNVGEFYSEFGSFLVNISVPENYVIASSGTLLPNAQEEEFIRKNISETKELIEKGFPKTDSFPPSSPQFKTVSYKLDNAHDFAWFADKRYHIQSDSVTLDRSGRSIKTFSYFSNINADSWKESVKYVNESVKYYSQWVGDYPYEVCKSVDGALSAGAGMEYPTITVISGGGGAKALEQVTAHEVGHNWFYGILASNERDYPWMDEGMNSFYDERYTEVKYPKTNDFTPLLESPIAGILGLKVFRPADFKTLEYIFMARMNMDQPISLHSTQFTNINYGISVYRKTADVLRYLQAWLGETKFDEMMQAYYNEWKFKHPYPEDFRKHVQTFTKQELNWLFDDLISSSKRVDYAITKVVNAGNNQFVKVKNKGGIASPVSITGYSSDSSATTFWYDGFDGTQKLSFPIGDFKRVAINYNGNMPDVNPKNNVIRTKGLFKKVGKPRIGFLSGVEHPEQSDLYVIPTLGYNYYNGFMTGLAFHNIGIIRKNLEFIANPMYAFNSSTLAGGAQIDYFIRPVSDLIKSITFTATGEQYRTRLTPYLQRVTLGTNVVLRDRLSAKKNNLSIGIRHIYLRTEPYLANPNESTSINENSFNQLVLSYSNKRKLNPLSIVGDFQQNIRFVKASITGNYRIPYTKSKKGLNIRVFAGTFLWKSDDFGSAGPDVRFRLSGQNGSQDYLFDDIYLGRNETTGILSQQMTMTDGGFKVFSFRGQTSDYLATINLNSTLPGKIPLRLYADIGHYFNGEIDADRINYNAGAALIIFEDVFEIYAPFVVSNAIQKTLDVNNVSFGERIRFVLNFSLVNPIKQLRKFDL